MGRHFVRYGYLVACSRPHADAVCEYQPVAMRDMTAAMRGGAAMWWHRDAGLTFVM